MQHLAQDQRCQIYALKKRGGLTQKEIAELVGTTQATVSREITRNSGGNGYQYKQAHNKAISRRRRASDRPRKMTIELLTAIEYMLFWSSKSGQKNLEDM